MTGPSKGSKTVDEHVTARKPDYYDDPAFDYSHFWENRQYEHEAEKLAISRLLEGKHFGRALDIGGGYGRLSIFLKQYAGTVTLVEPSRQQLDLAGAYLEGHTGIAHKQAAADNLPAEDGSVDLAVMIRVLHHIPEPSAAFEELARVLHDDGYAILEIANYLHVRNRFKHLAKRQKLPVSPVEISTALSDGTPFVNHNPHTVRRQLAHAGLKVERILSVSNLRSGKLKRLMPKRIMLALEGALQPVLARGLFGPSVFFLIRKVR